MCWCFRGCWFVAISVAVARIYREDLSRVTASRNRLGLSLSKRIRHGLIAKINGKRRPRSCKALVLVSGHTKISSTYTPCPFDILLQIHQAVSYRFPLLTLR
jgi:hypothetical protein